MDKINEIKSKLAKAAHKDEVTDEMNIKDLGLDSLDIVELLLQLEEDYGVHFDDMDMSAIVTVKDLLNVIESQLKLGQTHEILK